MDLKKYKTDPRVRDEGVWVDLPGTDDGTQIRIRSEDYAPYRKALTRIIEDQQSGGRYARRQNRVRLGDPTKFDEERGKAIAEHLLVDWRGLTEDGADVPYSRELAEKYLTDADYRGFYLAVSDAIDEISDMKTDWEADRGKS